MSEKQVYSFRFLTVEESYGQRLRRGALAHRTFPNLFWSTRVWFPPFSLVFLKAEPSKFCHLWVKLWRHRHFSFYARMRKLNLPARAPFWVAHCGNLFDWLTFPTFLFQFQLHAWTVQYFAGLFVVHTRDVLLPLKLFFNSESTEVFDGNILQKLTF